MPNVYYENTLTNATHDVTQTIAAAKWTTKRGLPATLELTVLADPVVQWELGGVLSVRDGGAGLFYGYIFKIERREGDLIGVTAYDQVRYLKNKGTYIFAAKRADEIVKKILDEANHELKTEGGMIVNSMLTLIKQAAVEVWESLQPTVFLYGKVTALTPLTVKVDNRFEISGDALVIMREFRPGDYPTHTHTVDPHLHGIAEHETERVDPHTHSTPEGNTGASGGHEHVVPVHQTRETPLTTNPEVYFGPQVGDRVVLLRNQGGQQFLILGRLP